MGLDQYVYQVKKRAVIDNFRFKDSFCEIAVMDFSRLWELQYYMSKLYESKGGKKEFNYKYLKVEEDDIKALESAIKEGTFIVEHDYNMEIVKSFIEVAKKAFKENDCIYYYSWW